MVGLSMHIIVGFQVTYFGSSHGGRLTNAMYHNGETL